MAVQAAGAMAPGFGCCRSTPITTQRIAEAGIASKAASTLVARSKIKTQLEQPQLGGEIRPLGRSLGGADALPQASGPAEAGSCTEHGQRAGNNRKVGIEIAVGSQRRIKIEWHWEQGET